MVSIEQREVRSTGGWMSERGGNRKCRSPSQSLLIIETADNIDEYDNEALSVSYDYNDGRRIDSDVQGVDRIGV